HVVSQDHKHAVSNPSDRSNFEEAVLCADSKGESAIMLVMKVVYWLAKECIPLSKYGSLMQLLKFLGTPNMAALKVGKNIDYTSYTTACDILSALSDFIDSGVTEKLQQSPTINIMTDESTDIVVHHKLCISARVVDPINLTPSTLFLTDLRITSATGEGIFNAIKEHLAGRNIALARVSGLGTDGASVMTGKKKGLTGRFLEHNPHLLNTHCSAHRLALCSEQAAEKIPAMKYYQQILESIFYYFKKSPDRCDKMQAVQKLLNDPCLKYREVHQVSWLSFYEALDAIFKTMDSLLTFSQPVLMTKRWASRRNLAMTFSCTQPIP
ncbi:ZN862-like protein, partial [Mya arenaria]